jgi:murein DD-endopeptidase MepM/ murein hydrolase activator NlpD
MISGAVGVVVTTSTSVSAAGFSCPGNSPTYAVRSGDSWFRIADRVDVRVGSLLDANDAALNDLLVVGDRLCLPPGADRSGACSFSYTVRSGDSWASIGWRAGTTARSLAAMNGTDTGRAIHPGDRICVPDGTPASAGSSTGVSSGSSGSGGSYTVVRGDSWARIASRAEVSMRSLLSANDANSRDLIVPGDVLRLPAGAKQPSSSRSTWVTLDAAPTQGPCGYLDTWGQARSSTRRHEGTDIFSGDGNYVYAVVDGRLTDRVWDGAGQNAGNAWTLTGPDGTRFFYAHLAGFAPEVRIGSRVQAGQVIGWIGSTGNASAPHLHFEIRPGGGSPVNPYPILRAQGGCNSGRPYTQPGGWVPNVIR